MEWIVPAWPAPARVRAVVTTRTGGVSQGPFRSLNLADHVGDDAAAVAENRARLRRRLGLQQEPFWLTQVHGCAVASSGQDEPRCEADAATAQFGEPACAVLTADCLPVLFCNRAGTRVAAAHAGWRGLAAGVLESTVRRFDDAPVNLMAWMGPAIGASAFQVGRDVVEAFTAVAPEDAAAFQADGCERWLADIYALAQRRLADLGVGFVAGGGYCTVSEPARFYSYRRDRVTGRMASLVWIE